MRKLLLVSGIALVLLVAMTPAAHAQVNPDLPSTIGGLGGTPTAVTEPGVVDNGAPGGAAPGADRLPRTGSDIGVLIWVGLAGLGSGAFAVATFRRRARAS